MSRVAAIVLLVGTGCGGSRDEDGDGFAADAGDCNDGDPAIHPGAVDWVGDQVDQDCDLEDGVDHDGDGYANVGSGGTDCDDAEPAVHPDRADDCNGIDDDCSGVPDDGEGSEQLFADGDGDGYGLDGVTTRACAPPPGYAAVGGDCNDVVAQIHPGQVERCNGVDDDCDGATDDPSAEGYGRWYLDDDGDGFGTPTSTADGCAAPSPQWVLDDTDCDDALASVNPGEPERCNGFDDDCDGAIDDASATDVSTWYADADEDGWGDSATAALACAVPAGAVAVGGDCADGDPAIHPAAVEVCGGGDEDCDTLVDEADPNVAAPVWYADSDGDGAGDPASPATACAAPGDHVASPDDCDDGDASRYLGAPEVPGDGIDQDCDGSDPPDGDHDGWTTPQDCDDADPNVSPTATDIVGDGVDQNCDAIDGTDIDRDGVASEASGGGDCLDTDASVHAGLDEVFGTGLDEDCDGRVDFVDVTVLGGPRVASTGAYGSLGSWLAGVGDLDGDGADEVVAGAPHDTPVGGSERGKVYVFSGAWGPDDTTDDAVASIVGATQVEQFGAWVGPLGDVTGDGVPDFGAASPYSDLVATASGAIYVWSGLPSGPLTPSSADLVVAGGVSSAVLGTAVALDVDGSGTDALLVAAVDGTSGGDAYLLEGPFAPLINAAAANTASFVSGDSAAETVAGDFDGDGADEIVFGSPTVASSSGAISLFRPPFSGQSTIGSAGADVYIEGAANDQLGGSLAVGDIDGDGQDDLVAGVWARSGGVTSSGAVFVLAGPVTNASRLDDALIRVDGSLPFEMTGYCVALLGDLDGDGAPELGSTSYGGLVNRLLPTPLSAGTWDATDVEIGEVQVELWGQVGDGQLSSADLDGDGVHEVLVGRPGALGTYAYAGAIYAIP